MKIKELIELLQKWKDDAEVSMIHKDYVFDTKLKKYLLVKYPVEISYCGWNSEHECIVINNYIE